MKITKRLMAIVLCLGIILLLSSCSGGGNSSETSQSSSASSGQSSGAGSGEESSTPAAEPAELVITYDGTGPIGEQTYRFSCMTRNGTSSELNFDGMLWQQEILKQQNVQISMELFDDSSYLNVFSTRLAAGKDLPDLIKLGDGDTDMKYLKSGLFQEMSPLLDQYGFNLNRVFAMEEFHSDYLAEITPDGCIYYIPFLEQRTTYPPTLQMNQRWLKAIGFDGEGPKDMDEFYEILTAFKTQDPNGNGEADEVPLYETAWYTQRFGPIWGLNLNEDWDADENGQVYCCYTTDRYRDFLNYFHKLYKEGLLYSEFAVGTWDDLYSYLANDTTGSIMCYFWRCTSFSQLSDPDWKINVDEPIWQGVVPPVGPYGDQAYIGPVSSGGGFGISRNCENPEALFCFIDGRYSEENLTTFWYGIEGVDYHLVDGQIVSNDVYLDNQNNYRIKMGYNFNGLPGIAPNADAVSCTQVQQRAAEIQPYVRLPLQGGFVLPEETEVIQLYLTDFSSFINQRFVSFINGLTSLDDESWNDYIETCHELHVDELRDVFQTRYDRMNASPSK